MLFFATARSRVLQGGAGICGGALPVVARASRRRLASATLCASELPRRVLGAIEREAVLPPASRVLVSVSGGADSVALLRMLLDLNGEAGGPRRWALEAVHFNHGLRAEAAEEEEFVRALAAEHDVPLHVRRLPPSWARADEGAGGEGGVQERARAWRRAESAAILEAGAAAAAAGGLLGQGVVVLGHHADDQLETVLLKCLRGCHLSNLHGMAWREGIFARPLLGSSKEELLSYLDCIGQEWREDPSNAEPVRGGQHLALRLLDFWTRLLGEARRGDVG